MSLIGKAALVALTGIQSPPNVPRLAERFRLHAVLTLPVTEADVEAILRAEAPA